MIQFTRSHSIWGAALLGLALTACAPSNDTAPSYSAGQVAAAVKTPMTFYAASRAADQGSFGATPALVAELQKKGLEAWIDEQMARPSSRIDIPFAVADFNGADAEAHSAATRYFMNRLFQAWLTSPDQLRLRVSWGLNEFVPINEGFAFTRGTAEYFNLLQKHAFGNYGDFLRELTVHPAMGVFLGNAENRPRSDKCPGCSPNENYARELMQLFSIGVIQLNLDGTPVRDNQGRMKETYTQKDVEELARALTGWRFAPSTVPLAKSDTINALQPMQPESWDGSHDAAAKTVIGVTFPANQTIQQDLDTAVALLMAHPNIAPFVSLRLIQHLVTSDPSPQYLKRVATVFRNNGQGITGDMKAVVKAVLMDPEARLGDVPGMDRDGFGKMRESVLWFTAAVRGLNCTTPLTTSDGNAVWMYGQVPFAPESVFSFYLPTDRAPGSNLLAPEQRLLITTEFQLRLNTLQSALLDVNVTGNSQAGCELALLANALRNSPDALIDLIDARWFRGAMPPPLRSSLVALGASQNWPDPKRAATQILGFALTSAHFGVIN